MSGIYRILHEQVTKGQIILCYGVCVLVNELDKSVGFSSCEWWHGVVFTVKIWTRPVCIISRKIRQDQINLCCVWKPTSSVSLYVGLDSNRHITGCGLRRAPGGEVNISSLQSQSNLQTHTHYKHVQTCTEEKCVRVCQSVYASCQDRWRGRYGEQSSLHTISHSNTLVWWSRAC